ncbi:uncharacterized protein LOC122074881 [Macadamia integrifolia]|uniref:uncharacterized protein LOC122074881 n=1 Tax=Macadamia integrifolia TaxID=60698 RepID=UPI001C4FA5EC|nr:uncharacterized protein LOC122074881 [Macadamia integrifolia]
MEEHNLIQPLIATTTTNTNATAAASTTDDDITASISSIINRMVFLFFIAIVSIWANYEASKGFEVTIINDAGQSPAGRRFALFFVSDDKATRIVLNTSYFAEKLLYPDATHLKNKKQVNRVTLRLAGRNLSQAVVVNMTNNHEFVLHINPSVMEETNVDKAMVSAIQRGMARVWVWDGEMSAPTSLLDGMVEYVGISAGFAATSNYSGDFAPELSDGNSCWEDRDRLAVANFLDYCERVRHGFIVRLNQHMREGWHVRTMDDALGLPAQQLCSSYYYSTIQIPHTMGPTHFTESGLGSCVSTWD